MYVVIITCPKSDAMDFTRTMSTKLERMKDWCDEQAARWPSNLSLGVYDTKRAIIVYSVKGGIEP